MKLKLITRSKKGFVDHYVVKTKTDEKIHLWGIEDCALVSQDYREDIEDIIYEFNHDESLMDKRTNDTFYYPLRYMIKNTPEDVERAIRDWFINGEFTDPNRFKIVQVPDLDYKGFVIYDSFMNELLPLAQFDFLYDQDVDKFKNFISKNFDKRAKISTYYLVCKNAIELDWHILTFLDSYYKRDLLLEDVGIWPEKAKELQQIFEFSCPVCTNTSTPAGCIKFPKPFYEKNKKTLVEKYFSSKFKIQVSDPELDLSNYDFVKNIMEPCITENNSITLTQSQYVKISNNKDLQAEKNDYADYVYMAKQISENFVMPWDIHSARQIKSLHDAMIKEYNLRKNTSPQELKDKYLKVKSKYPKFEFSDDKFTIMYPKDIDDLSLEGQSLHHCVGSYKSRVLDKSAIILFLRTNDDLDTPFVTMHIVDKGGTWDLVQAHGVCNCSIKTIDGVYPFVEGWCKKFHIKMENIDRAI